MKKKVLFFTILAILIISCEKKVYYSTPNTLSGKYVHVLENCDNTNPDENCMEFIEFKNDNQANILLNGNDIVHNFRYKIKGFILSMEKGEEEEEESPMSLHCLLNLK